MTSLALFNWPGNQVARDAHESSMAHAETRWAFQELGFEPEDGIWNAVPGFVEAWKAAIASIQSTPNWETDWGLICRRARIAALVSIQSTLDWEAVWDAILGHIAVLENPPSIWP